MKLPIPAQNRPNSLSNNEKQLLPLKMRDQSQSSRNPLSSHILQEAKIHRVYVKPYAVPSPSFGKILKVRERSQFAETNCRSKHYTGFLQIWVFPPVPHAGGTRGLLPGTLICSNILWAERPGPYVWGLISPVAGGLVGFIELNSPQADEAPGNRIKWIVKYIDYTRLGCILRLSRACRLNKGRCYVGNFEMYYSYVSYFTIHPDSICRRLPVHQDCLERISDWMEQSI